MKSDKIKAKPGNPNSCSHGTSHWSCFSWPLLWVLKSANRWGHQVQTAKQTQQWLRRWVLTAVLTGELLWLFSSPSSVKSNTLQLSRNTLTCFTLTAVTVVRLRLQRHKSITRALTQDYTMCVFVFIVGYWGGTQPNCSEKHEPTTWLRHVLAFKKRKNIRSVGVSMALVVICPLKF